MLSFPVSNKMDHVKLNFIAQDSFKVQRLRRLKIRPCLTVL